MERLALRAGSFAAASFFAGPFAGNSWVEGIACREIVVGAENVVGYRVF